MDSERAGKEQAWTRLLALIRGRPESGAVAGFGSRIDQLTGLRFFAALLVFTSHLKWEHSWSFVGKMAEQGSVGVSFFFVLSGFVISYSYGWRLRSGDVSRAKYFALRVARLWPLHFLTGLPFAVFLVWHGGLDVWKYGANLLFAQSWLPSAQWYFAFNGPSWSLSNEMFFYAAFIGLAFLGTRAKIAAFISMIAVIVAAMLVLLGTDPDIQIAGSRPLQHWLFYVFPLLRLDEFLLGMIIFDYWKGGKLRLPGLSYVTIPALLVAMYLCVPHVPEMLRYHLFYMPFVALLLVSFLSGATAPIRLFASRPVVLLGEASFAFYLIHQPIVNFAEQARQKLDVLPSDLLFAALLLATCTVLALIVHLFVEKPLNSVLRKLIGRSGL